MKYYQAEMHCHTSEVSPCSCISANQIVDGYEAAGYRYLFITDHYHPSVLDSPEMSGLPWEKRVRHMMSGYEAAKKAADGTDLLVLPGVEVVLNRDEQTKVGDDFLVYGFDDDFLLENPWLYKLSYEDFYDVIRRNGLLTFQAHPYRYGRKPVLPICYDGIEVVNTHPRHVSRNGMAVDFAADHGLYTIGGSDTHAPEDVGRGGVMLPGGIESAKEFVSYVKENGSPELIVTFGA